MKKIRNISLLLVVIMIMNISVVATEKMIDNESIIGTTQSEITYPESLDKEVIATANHIKRMHTEEASMMNVAMYKNADETVTSYIFSENIKYIDKTGKISDKSSKLFSDSNGNYRTENNDIITSLPKNIKDGVSISYNGYDIKFIHNPLTSSKSVISRNKVNNKVTYSNVYGEHTMIRYTPQLSGVKEDVILNEYKENFIISYTIYTDGLALKNNDGYTLTLYDEDIGFNMNIGLIEIFDSASGYAVGTYKVKTVSENQEYMVTIIPDHEFLKSSNTVYPVTIDPFYEIHLLYNNTKAIYDAPLYINRPALKAGTSIANNVGNNATGNLGESRSVFKFPGLMSYIANNNITADMINTVSFYSANYEAPSEATIVYAYQYTGPYNWTESSICANDGVGYSTQYFSYLVEGTSMNSYFNIKSAVLNWLQNSDNAGRGIILVSGNPNPVSNYIRYVSTENTENTDFDKPFVTINHLESQSQVGTGRIKVVVRNPLGLPQANAMVCVYPPTGSTPHMAFTSSGGVAIIDGLSTSLTYRIQAISEDYKDAIYETRVQPSDSTQTSITTRTLVLREDPGTFESPIYGFSPSSKWPHLSTCDDSCWDSFCPYTYIASNQNFGWRYHGGLEFHCGLDIVTPNLTPLYNILPGDSIVTKSDENSECGWYIQIFNEDLNLYVTYMHLASEPYFSEYDDVSEGDEIGESGNTGAVSGQNGGYHLHISISESATLYNSDGSGDFWDPLAYIS